MVHKVFSLTQSINFTKFFFFLLVNYLVDVSSYGSRAHRNQKQSGGLVKMPWCQQGATGVEFFILFIFVRCKITYCQTAYWLANEISQESVFYVGCVAAQKVLESDVSRA